MGLKYITHTAYDITYHFTFIPKYRRRKLVGNIKERLEGMIRFCAQVNSFTIVELNIQPDHVHLVMSCKPMYSPSQIMQTIKGGTSKKLKKLYPGSPETIWSDSFWSDGYYIGTVGVRNIKDVISYVQSQ